jgi:hypothetical protein
MIIEGDDLAIQDQPTRRQRLRKAAQPPNRITPSSPQVVSSRSGGVSRGRSETGCDPAMNRRVYAFGRLVGVVRRVRSSAAEDGQLCLEVGDELA